MEKNLSTFHKNVKNLSPIASNKTIKTKADLTGIHPSNSKSKILEPIMDNKLHLLGSSSRNKVAEKVEKFDTNSKENTQSPQIITSKKDKDSSFKFSKNINEYRHLLNGKVGDPEMGWILELRTCSKSKFKNYKNIPDVHPRFYIDEIDKFKKKNLKNELKSSKSDLKNLEHLFTKRLGGTANSSQIGFESTLRNFRTVIHEDEKSTKDKWRTTSTLSKPRLFSSYVTNLSNYNTKDKFFSNTNFNSTVRTYEPVYDVNLN